MKHLRSSFSNAVKFGEVIGKMKQKWASLFMISETLVTWKSKWSKWRERKYSIERVFRSTYKVKTQLSLVERPSK